MILRELGSKVLFASHLLAAWKRLGLWKSLRPITDQVAFVAYRSLPTVALAGVFVGAILALQFSAILEKYEASTLLGGLSTSAVIREVGPLIISFLLAGKVGAFTAAELGTMRVTDQIDAVRCLGSDPMERLVLPRFAAIALSSLLLLTIGLAVSVAGAMAVGCLFSGLNPLQFLEGIPRFSTGWTLFCGFFKSAVYGVIVALVACHEGYTARGGAMGVGRAVTRAAIQTQLAIVVANFGTSQVLDALSLLWAGEL